MTPKAFAKLALSMPDAHEEPHFERTSFRVGKKIFATMTKDGKEAMIGVAPPEKVTMLLESEPEVFFSYGKWTSKNGALGVRLAKIKAGEMKALLVDSWKRVASKRAIAAFDDTPARPR